MYILQLFTVLLFLKHRGEKQHVPIIIIQLRFIKALHKKETVYCGISKADPVLLAGSFFEHMVFAICVHNLTVSLWCLQ